jgi:hypothetical protein
VSTTVEPSAHVCPDVIDVYPLPVSTDTSRVPPALLGLLAVVMRTQYGGGGGEGGGGAGGGGEGEGGSRW